jgi:uncharacterized membrane protein
MIRPILIGIVAGMRSLTPIAVISWAAQRSQPSMQGQLPEILSSPRASKVALALAAAELLGDKIPSAPDRIITPGLLVRIATGAVAGTAVAPREEQYTGAVLGATAAVLAAYASFIEDALAVGAAVLVTRMGR